MGLHGPMQDDVLIGAEALASQPACDIYENIPAQVQPWEWRQLISNAWVSLPIYVASVFESAFQSGVRHATVFVGKATYDLHFLICDLENFTVAYFEAKGRMRARVRRRDRDSKH